MPDKTIKLTLTDPNGQSGLIFEASEVDPIEIALMLAMSICAVARNVGLDPVAYAAMIAGIAEDISNSNGMMIDVLGLLEKRGRGNG